MTLSPLAALLSRKRLLLFDLDGTLVDSSPLHARAFSETLAPEGLAVHYPDIAGMTTAAAIDRLAAGAGRTFDAATRERLIGAKKARAFALIESELEAIEGAVEFVRAAGERYPLALCTSASRGNVAAALARVGLERAFDPLVTGDDVERSKPEPDAFLLALEAHGVPAADALVFEDSESGIEAASRAGIEAVRISADGSAPGSVEWGALLAALGETP
jgi:beta-phosphoglucomutase